MQLLYVANRYERKADLVRWLEGGLILVCDRYTASSIAYGEAQGLDPSWLAEVQRFLPLPNLTILLDIAPETAVARKALDRDRYERDRDLQSRVRESYRRQAEAGGWLALDGERAKDVIAADVLAAVTSLLG
jgi:dTMP kinase